MRIHRAVLLAVLALSPTVALAGPNCTTEPQAKWMSEEAMKAKIDGLGYKVKNFKVTTGSCYEIYGWTKDNKKAEVYFHPVTGDVVKAEIE